MLYEHQFDASFDHPAFDGTPRVLLLATTPRCGSHFLGHILSADGRFGCPFEYLHPSNMTRWREVLGHPRGAPLIPALASRRTSPLGIFAVKAHWPHFSRHWGRQRGALAAQPAAVLRLYRRDVLAQAVSFDVASQTGQWISAQPGTCVPTYRAGGIRRRAAEIRAENAAWTAWAGRNPDVPQIAIAYEDFARDPSSDLRRIRELLLPDDPREIAFTVATERQANPLSRKFMARFRARAKPEDAWMLEPQDLRA